MVKLAERAPLPEIKTLRQTLNLDSGFEFKYHTTKLRQKDFFFEMIQSLSFQIRAVVVKKQLLGGNLTQLNGQDFTTHFLAQLILRASDMEIANDILIIDSATSASIRALRLKLSEECRKANRVRPFKKIVGGDSHREDGLQLADMIAGAIRDRVIFSQERYYKTFAKNVVDLWVMPNREVK